MTSLKENETAQILISFKSHDSSMERDAKRARPSSEDIVIIDESHVNKNYDTKSKQIALIKFNRSMLRSRLADITYAHGRSYHEYLKLRKYYNSIKEAQESLLDFDLDNPLRAKSYSDISKMNLTLCLKLNKLLLNKYGINLPSSCAKLEYMASEISSFDLHIQNLQEKFHDFDVRTTLLSKLNGSDYEDEKKKLILMYALIGDDMRSIIRDMKVFA